MKESTIRVLVVSGLAGLLLSNVACGSSSNNGDGGGGGGGGGGRGGGSGGSDAGVTHRLYDTFTTANSLSGYSLSEYPDTATFNLAGSYTVDGGTDGGTDGGVAPRPTLEWDGADGKPDAGALKVTVTYTDYRQYVDIVKQLSPALDLSNRVLKAQVKLVSSTPAAFTGGIQFHASAGASYAYFGNSGLAFGAVGAWTPILLDLGASASTFDGTMIVQLGIQVYSGDPPTGTTALAAPITVVFEIDTVTD